MRLSYNSGERRFECLFQDFQGDLDAVKCAGFKTSGPPEWIWWTNKIAVLNKLRRNKPASGLTILTDALEEYKKLVVIDEANQIVLKQLKAAKTAAKRAAHPPAEKGSEDFVSYCTEIEKTIPIAYVPPVPPVWTGPRCWVCKSPVYIYENQGPPAVCLWCEKVMEDESNTF